MAGPALPSRARPLDYAAMDFRAVTAATLFAGGRRQLLFLLAERRSGKGEDL